MPPPIPILLRPESLHSPTARELIRLLDGELSRRYPEPGATHFRLDEDEVAPGAGIFLVAWVEDTAVGCGALRRVDARTGEIKRMYVAPRVRGRGVGRMLLQALEEHACGLGLRRIVLETGARQADALALYTRSGYVRIPPFGEYTASPLSICLGKGLPGRQGPGGER